MPSIIVDQIEASYSSASAYSAFDGITSDNIEGRWYGFKHSSSGGEAIVFFISGRTDSLNSLNGACLGKRSNGSWTFRYLFRF